MSQSVDPRRYRTPPGRTMRRRPLLLLALAAASLLAGPALVGSAVADPPELAPGSHPGASYQASDRVAYHYARGQGGTRAARPGSRVLMTSHGGKVMHASYTKAIFWGTSWNGYSGDKITGIDSWYTGFGGSNYAKTTTEYTDSTGKVGTGSSYLGSTPDYSPASGGQSTSAILAEVAKVIGQGTRAANA